MNYQYFGCNVGNDVIPYNGLFYWGTPIHIVTYVGDPQCGIFRNQFNYYRNQQCLGNGRFGNVIQYNQTDINCGQTPPPPVVNTPVDSYVPIFGLAIILLSLKKKFKV